MWHRSTHHVFVVGRGGRGGGGLEVTAVLRVMHGLLGRCNTAASKQKGQEEQPWFSIDQAEGHARRTRH